MSDALSAAVARHSAEARELLLDLIRFDSTPGNESDAVSFCAARFDKAGCQTELIPINEQIASDPEYSRSDSEISYQGRHNLVAWRRGSGGGRSVILQSHMDVVPADGWAEAFEPHVEGSTVIGRGSCDAKGQVAAIWLAMKALDDVGFTAKGNIQAQVVVEEELGGNGALDLIRKGHAADAVIILEGTKLQIHPANRGAIWFRIEIEGLPCHMGRKHEGVSAIDLSYKVIQALYEYEQRIIADSANYPGFERYDRPVQVNVGMLHSGSWPSMVAGSAVMEGGVGFLPNRSMEQVKREVRETIESIDDPWLREHYTLSFPKLHNDSYEIDYSHPAVGSLEGACRDSGIDADVFGWNVSCDARLYSRIGNMPAIVFGPGSIAQGHSNGEFIDFDEAIKAAEVLARFVIDWCG